MATYEIAVCIDCYMVIANGETYDSNGNDITDKVSVEIAKWWGADVHMAPGDDYNAFSKYPCDACHSYLAGERLQVIVMDL